MSNYTQLDKSCANAIRTLTLDAIQKAKSGHPGMPLGMADAVYVLYDKFFNYNAQDVAWFNRDRLIVSAGHGSMLPYSLLYLLGQPEMTLDELKRFRQLGSKTPGHPENHITKGIEVTTGPLGAGTANSVGMAIAEAWMAAHFNRPGFEVVDHYTYTILGDGCMEEGISHEAASLAGHLGLGRLIWLYDDNSVTIDGPTDLSYSDDVPRRFEAYGWHVQTVDGHDMDEVEEAIAAAKAITNKPSIICCKTIIGIGMPTRQGTRLAHSDEPGEEEVKAAKRFYGEDPEKTFFVRDEVMAQWRAMTARGAQTEANWQKLFEAYAAANPELAAQLKDAIAGKLRAGWDANLPVYNPADKPVATRAAGGAAISAIAATVPTLLGGSADLTPSNNTLPKDPATGKDYASFKAGDFSGRYIRFGVREHAMGGILNGMALHGGVIPYGGTFFAFSDYNRPAIRLAALSHAHSIFLFTHDSIGVGEDGPTHQPVEQLASLRAMPGLTVIRPADANETVAAWRIAVAGSGPFAMVLARQAVPILPKQDGVEKGAYVMQPAENAQVVLVASGSEVALALDGAKALAEQGVRASVVSMPSWELFDAQDAAYRASVLPPELPKVVIEAGVSMGWHKYTGPRVAFVTQETFGASAPAKDVFPFFGFTAQNVVDKALGLLK